MARLRFPKADMNAVQDFYTLGRAKLDQLAALSPTKLYESIQFAQMAEHEWERANQRARANEHTRRQKRCRTPR